MSTATSPHSNSPSAGNCIAAETLKPWLRATTQSPNPIDDRSHVDGGETDEDEDETKLLRSLNEMSLLQKDGPGFVGKVSAWFSDRRHHPSDHANLAG